MKDLKNSFFKFIDNVCFAIAILLFISVVMALTILFIPLGLGVICYGAFIYFKEKNV